jgi:hypothetical protein
MGKLNKKIVAEAIKGSGGIISTIAKRLKCEWHTAKNFIDSNEELQIALQDETEAILDMAEGVVYQSIKNDNTQDAKWLLATKGKGRGFSEKIGVDANVGITLVIDSDDADL